MNKQRMIFFQGGVNISAISRMAGPMGKGPCSFPMEANMRAGLKMESRMVMEFYPCPMALNIKVNGRMVR